jgi:spore maturation protein CgeB
MVLCDKLDKSKKLDELFEDGKDIVYYDDIIDCIYKMNHYSGNDAEREKIAVNGYNKVMDNHTQKQRVEFIINKYKEWKSE